VEQIEFDTVIVDQVEGFQLGSMYFKKSSGWTRDMVQEVSDLIEKYYQSGYDLGYVEAEEYSSPDILDDL